ncbi:hypothetical protein GWI33_008414 [Rhynchophorus ferrugineus]|uniref:Uncharacterized protein n=1 Tax=Rhynchophorus ferrugineus TaxID=354439 RepID=A0A834II67_RHYFE|nr:hypothetical protein GWI33_008414 [Rhynchophorus ferrugineus]
MPKKSSNKKGKKFDEETPIIIVEGPSQENLKNIPYVDEEKTKEQVIEDGEDKGDGPSRSSRIETPYHRKNSISLPNLDDFEVIQQAPVTDFNSASELETDDELDVW